MFVDENKAVVIAVRKIKTMLATQAKTQIPLLTRQKSISESIFVTHIRSKITINCKQRQMAIAERQDSQILAF